MWRALHRIDERLSGAVAGEPAEVVGGDYDHLLAAVYGDVLRPLVLRAPYDLAESSLCLLELPPSGPRAQRFPPLSG
jgi:hypothetical protein